MTSNPVVPSLLPVPFPVRTSADNLTLSCTVAGEGRFSWQWTDPDGNPPSAVIFSDVTRTSIASFTNIRGTAGGTLERNLTFTCTATHNPLVSGVERNNVSQEITVSLQGICIGKEHDKPILATPYNIIALLFILLHKKRLFLLYTYIHKLFHIHMQSPFPQLLLPQLVYQQQRLPMKIPARLQIVYPVVPTLSP